MRRVRVFDERLGQKPPDQPTWAGKYTQPNEAPVTSSHNRRAIPTPELVIVPSQPPTDKRPERSVRHFTGTQEWTDEMYAAEDRRLAEVERQKAIAADKRRRDAVLRKAAAAREQWKQEQGRAAEAADRERHSNALESQLIQEEITSIAAEFDLPESAVRAIDRKLRLSNLHTIKSFWIQEAEAYSKGGM
jgi:hypothetical protein